MGETRPVHLQDTYWVTYIASIGPMLRSSMKVAEMYPGKNFPIKCDNVLLGALITNMQNCKKSANMKEWVIGKVLADINATFTQTIFQSLSHNLSTVSGIIMSPINPLWCHSIQMPTPECAKFYLLITHIKKQ